MQIHFLHRLGIFGLTLLFFLSFLSCGSMEVANNESGLEERPSNTTCLASNPIPPADNLADTGCFASLKPLMPASGLIPYSVNMPLWSDGATKDRWMALPDGANVQIDENGDWVFPVGTVLVKNFSVAGQLIETRLLMHVSEDVWNGFTYEWDDAVTSATLVGTGGKARMLSNGQNWFYPTRTQCLQCHTQVAGRSLGPETPQMNRLFTYPTTGITANQITTLVSIGVLDTDPGPPENLPKFYEHQSTLPTPEETEMAARDYLHVNCSICHRPGGTGGGMEDFRYTTPLAQMNACDQNPSLNTFGIPDAKLLFPGDPDKSILWFRMSTLGEGRMPPLGTQVVDSWGLDVVGGWITSISFCP